MDLLEAQRRFAAAPVARLATSRPDGSPHVVPIVFALAGDVVVTAIDRKPKTTTHLQRLANLRRDPRCSLLVDHYEDDWSRLWWVRADGEASIVDAPARERASLRALVARYPAYREEPPTGPLIEIHVRRWRWWSGS